MNEENCKEGAELAPERNYGSYNHQKCHRGRTTQALGIHNLPQIPLDAGSGTEECNVWPAGFWTYLGPIPLYSPICTFWNGNVDLVPLNVGNV